MYDKSPIGFGADLRLESETSWVVDWVVDKLGGGGLGAAGVAEVVEAV